MNGHTFAERLVVLEERSEACVKSREDVETRLRKIERNQWFATGAIVALQIILKFI
jgi:hypothetical protein